jgi:hypothetical protein
VNAVSLSVPADRLPADPAQRDQLLTNYFADRVPHSTPDTSGDWTVTVDTAPAADFYIDPRLDEGLRWWGCSVADIPFAHRRIRGAFLSLSDAWTLLSISQWLARQDEPPPHVTVIHIDDHDDLMCPRLGVHGGRFTDLITGKSMLTHNPTSVADAIESGAVGMGSFLAPLLHTMPSVDIRHLCDTTYARTRTGRFWLVRTTEPDEMLAPGSQRPAIEIIPVADASAAPDQTAGTYQVGDDETGLLAGIDDGPILLHIDLDFFNNRFNGDSDWANRQDRHDPTHDQVIRRVERLVAELTPLRHRIVDVEIGISPGFFPAELWAPVCDMLIDRLARADDSA